MATEHTPLLEVPDLARAALSARRQSLNAIAGGRQSEFGGPNKGLEDFREIVNRNRLLSRSEQRQDITEQVRHIIEDEPGLVAPRPRLDVTTSVREVGILIAWSTPQIIIGFCRYSIVGANIFSLGKLGTKELAAANLGFLSSNVAGYSIIIGLVSALDTLANQAGKSASPKLASLYAMRTFIVCMMFMPFIFLFMLNAEPFFRLVLHSRGDDGDEIVQLAASYLKIMSLAMPAVSAYECLRRYLQSCGKMVGPAVVFALASFVSIFLNWLLVHGPKPYRIGFQGAPLATVLAYNFLLICMILYALFASPKGSWAGFSKEMFKELKIVAIFGVAGIASTCSEWYAFELIGFAAALFSPATQAATAIYSTSISIFYQIPLGLGTAASIRVGNLLGRGLAHKAQRTALSGQALTLAVMMLSTLFLIAFRGQFGRLYSDDPEVLAIVRNNVALLAIIVIFDGIQGINGGILRGAGLPTAAARINLMAYWLFGLPIGAMATWRLRNIRGLYTGLAAAVVLATAWMCLLIWRNQWDARAAEAMARISLQDSDAKVVHTPANELDGITEESVDDEDADTVVGTPHRGLV